MTIKLRGKTNKKNVSEGILAVNTMEELGQKMHIRTILVLISMSLDSVCI